MPRKKKIQEPRISLSERGRMGAHKSPWRSTPACPTQRAKQMFDENCYVKHPEKKP